MKAIPTEYRGARFRSRLEARWAALFDIWDLEWDYEPVDLPGYIPDFMVREWMYRDGLEIPVLVEVGPCITARDYSEKARKARKARDAGELPLPLIVVGTQPSIRVALPNGDSRDCVGLVVDPDPWFDGWVSSTRNWVALDWRRAGREVQWNGHDA